jgi:hypothetical protein
MKKFILGLGVLSMLSSQVMPVQAQVWKKIGYGIGIASGATTAFYSVASLIALTRTEQEGTQSNINSKNQLQIAHLEESYFDYLADYHTAIASGMNFEIEDIKQPYIKEVMTNITNNAELIEQIETEVPGTSRLEKINKVLTQELLSK